MTDNFEFDHSENVFEDGDGKEGEESYELPHTIKLKSPKQIGKNTTMDEIVFSKRPEAGMMMALPIMKLTDMQLGHFLPIIAGMAGRPKEHIMKLEFGDLQDCLKVVTYFLRSSGVIS